MALSTSYYTVDGEIVGESSGGVRLDYLTDALGSVTAKVNQAGVVASTARYKPYGDKLAGSEYMFGWVGSQGYRKSVTGSYIRTRHFLAKSSRWTTTDLLWPFTSNPYGYVTDKPTCDTDPFGLSSGPVPIQGSVERATINGCGKIFFRTHWTLPASMQVAGAVIQHVKIEGTCSKCGKDTSTCKDKPGWKNGVYKAEYLEAWRVDADGSFNWQDKDYDFYTFEGRDGCTTGTLKWTGKVSFYPGYKVTPPMWRDSPSGHPANGLMIVDPITPEALKSLGSGPNQPHTLDARWNCCLEPADNYMNACMESLCQRDWHSGIRPDPSCFSTC